MRRRLWLYIGIVTVLLIAAYFVFDSFYVYYRVNGDSMAPTLHDGEVYRVSKRESIQRGDVIAFRSDQESLTYIKRVIALPGERVAIRGNHVYINDRKLAEPYLPNHPDIKDVAMITVPPAHFYVLGDERLDSYDSRHFGPISRSRVIGKLQTER